MNIVKVLPFSSLFFCKFKIYSVFPTGDTELQRESAVFENEPVLFLSHRAQPSGINVILG